MVRSFASRDTEELFARGSPRKFRSSQAQAERKLQVLDSAMDLNDVHVPPGNRLEKLGGDLRGQHGNGGSVSVGEMMAGTSKSLTAIEGRV